MITQHDLDNWFTYHPPTEDQIPKYIAIRDAGKMFAKVILKNTPPSADQTTAIRKIREAVMTANAAIACDPNNRTPEQIEEFEKFKRGLIAPHDIKEVSDPDIDLTIPDDDKGTGRTPRELR